MAFRYSGSGWRVAPSIRTFGDQIMTARGHTTSYPVDGTLGDVDHSNRVSDHNPDDDGIVRAIDFYEHQPGFVDDVFEAIRLAKDPRCKYAIHDKRMFASYNTTGGSAWTWRKYTGVNGHQTHGHLSVVASALADQTHSWPMPGIIQPSIGDDVRSLRLIVQEAAQKGWLKTQAEVDEWMRMTGFPDDPGWQTFENAWAGWKQEEWKQLQGHPHGAPGGGTPDLSDYAKVEHGHGVIGKTT